MKKKTFVAIFAMLMVIFATLTGCVSSAVASGWAGIIVNGGNLYTVSSLGLLDAFAANGNTLWSLPVDSSAKVAVYGTPAISGGQLYVAGYNGKMYTFNVTTGQSSGSGVTLDAGDSKPIVGGPVVDQGKVFVASSNGNLYALDATTLAQLWKFATGNKIWSTPAVDNGTVFVGSFDKKVYAVDETTGKKKWSFSTQGAIIATPVVDSGTVYVVSFDRQIYALDEATGSLKWEFPAPGQSGNKPQNWFWATPVIQNGILYAPCLDGKVYAVKTQDGSLVTAFDLGKEISSSPVIADGKVIVATHDAKIYTLDATAKKTQLIKDLNIELPSAQSKVVSSPLSTANGIVYIHGLQSDIVFALNIATGDLRAFALGAVTASPPITATATSTVTAITTATATVTVTATK